MITLPADLANFDGRYTIFPKATATENNSGYVISSLVQMNQATKKEISPKLAIRSTVYLAVVLNLVAGSKPSGRTLGALDFFSFLAFLALSLRILAF